MLSTRLGLLSTRHSALLLVLLALVTTVPALGLVFTAGGRAEAHGTPMKPGSRTFLCWRDALTDTGEIKPVNPASVEANYSWTGRLPDGKSGRHVIYMVWQRSDSTETFYSCSDVVFDGGNGEVTGIHDPGNPTESPPGACTATRRATGSWNGGYQAEVTVTNTGDVPMLGWMVDFGLPAGQSITNLWGGRHTTQGQAVMVHNAD